MAKTDESVTAYLAENPRMIGVLFTIMLMLAQAGNVTAACAATTSGP